MHFTEFSIPESTEWMERSDILFLLDCGYKKVPFVSKSIFSPAGSQFTDSYGWILEHIHPEDLPEFQNIIEGKSMLTNTRFRILDQNDHLVSFIFQRLRIGGHGSTKILAGIMEKVPAQSITI